MLFDRLQALPTHCEGFVGDDLVQVVFTQSLPYLCLVLGYRVLQVVGEARDPGLRSLVDLRPCRIQALAGSRHGECQAAILVLDAVDGQTLALVHLFEAALQQRVDPVQQLLTLLLVAASGVVFLLRDAEACLRAAAGDAGLAPLASAGLAALLVVVFAGRPGRRRGGLLPRLLDLFQEGAAKAGLLGGAAARFRVGILRTEAPLLF